MVPLNHIIGLYLADSRKENHYPGGEKFDGKDPYLDPREKHYYYNRTASIDGKTYLSVLTRNYCVPTLITHMLQTKMESFEQDSTAPIKATSCYLGAKSNFLTTNQLGRKLTVQPLSLRKINFIRGNIFTVSSNHNQCNPLKKMAKPICHLRKWCGN